MIKRALYTLSGNGKISISKDKEYKIEEDKLGIYVIDNYGEKVYLTPEELKYRFI